MLHRPSDPSEVVTSEHGWTHGVVTAPEMAGSEGRQAQLSVGLPRRKIVAVR